LDAVTSETFALNHDAMLSGSLAKTEKRLNICQG